MAEKESSCKKNINDIIKEYQKMTLKLNLFANTNLVFIFIVSIGAVYSILFGENFFLKEIIDSLSDKTTSEELIKNNFTIIITTLITTKLTILSISVFILQILYKTYRYNLRLCDHYRSRANILTLKGNLKWEINDLVSLFSMDNIDIGQGPKTDEFNLINK